jgi:hypothetical protein
VVFLWNFVDDILVARVCCMLSLGLVSKFLQFIVILLVQIQEIYLKP